MNTLRNSVQLIGRLGADPEIKSIDNSRKVARLRLATNDEYTSKTGEKISDTQWHSLVVWGKLAEFTENYLFKGQEIAVGGKLGYREYTGTDGIKHYVTEITVNEILMTGNRRAE